MGKKILIVDDYKTVRTLLRMNLSKEDFVVVEAENGAEGFELANQEKPDLIISDILMPQMDGFQLCQRIRELSFVPIIVLTAVQRDEDKVRAFSLGADDYVTKPVSGRELVARVEAHLRRNHWPTAGSTASYADSAISVDSARHEVFVRGEKKDLTPVEYRLLTVLVQNAGQTISHRRLLKEVWGPEYDTPELVKWHVRNLRQKIEADANSPELVIIVRGFGYRYEPPAKTSS